MHSVKQFYFNWIKEKWKSGTEWFFLLFLLEHDTLYFDVILPYLLSLKYKHNSNFLPKVWKI